MPMVLRSRKSMRPGDDDGGGLELPSGRARRSVRLQRTTYEVGTFITHFFRLLFLRCCGKLLSRPRRSRSR